MLGGKKRPAALESAVFPSRRLCETGAAFPYKVASRYSCERSYFPQCSIHFDKVCCRPEYIIRRTMRHFYFRFENLKSQDI